MSVLTEASDLVDQMAGLAPGSPSYLLRHQREKVVQATQGSYNALFDPTLPGLSLAERLLVAWYACRLTPSVSLAAHYRAQLDGLISGAGSMDTAPIDRSATSAAPNDAAPIEGAPIDAATLAAVESDQIEQVVAPRLRAILRFTHTLITRPIDGDKAALEALPAAGISTPAVVTLAQLIAFLSYQTRLVSGLAAMNAAVATPKS